MATAPLLRQRILPLAGLTTALVLYPKTTTHAEEPSSEHRLRKPIYSSPTTDSHPSSSLISATTPSPASGETEYPPDETSPRKPTPTDRLAAQIRKSRILLHTYAVGAEDAVNAGMDRVLHAEHSFTSTIASLAPPKESNEKLLPGGIYVLVAAMAGSILSRNRNIAIRFVTPLVTGVTTAHYVVPHTTGNVKALIWRYEERFPVVRDNHLRIERGVRHFLETGKAHSLSGIAVAEEKVQGFRESVEEWVRKGR